MKVKEFAKIAGVSPSTISKIIHHNDQNISAETKERILSLAKSAGFLPLQIAGKKTQNFLLGILLRDFSDFPKMKDLIEVLQTYGYQCILSSSENTDLGEKVKPAASQGSQSSSMGGLEYRGESGNSKGGSNSFFTAERKGRKSIISGLPVFFLFSYAKSLTKRA